MTERSPREIQKLAWFKECAITKSGLKDPMDLRFEANRYGPHADRLRHLLDSLDSSYLQCEKRLGDAKPEDVIWFDQSRKQKVAIYLKSGEAEAYILALDRVSSLIDGFQSPLGMEPLGGFLYYMKLPSHVQTFSLFNHANYAFEMAFGPLQTFDDIRVRSMRVIIYHV